MNLPFSVRINKGSFVMILPKQVGFFLELDKKLNEENKTVKLIAETTNGGVLLRYPTKEEIDRFSL